MKEFIVQHLTEALIGICMLIFPWLAKVVGGKIVKIYAQERNRRSNEIIERLELLETQHNASKQRQTDTKKCLEGKLEDLLKAQSENRHEQDLINQRLMLIIETLQKDGEKLTDKVEDLAREIGKK